MTIEEKKTICTIYYRTLDCCDAVYSITNSIVRFPQYSLEEDDTLWHSVHSSFPDFDFTAELEKIEYSDEDDNEYLLSGFYSTIGEISKCASTIHYLCCEVLNLRYTPKDDFVSEHSFCAALCL